MNNKSLRSVFVKRQFDGVSILKTILTLSSFCPIFSPFCLGFIFILLLFTHMLES